MLGKQRLHGRSLGEIEFAAKRLEFYCMLSGAHYLVRKGTDRTELTDKADKHKSLKPKA